MVGFDAFRQDLATALLDCADRRRSVAGEHPTGEDLKVIALFERLAVDVANIDVHVFLIFELTFKRKHLARHFVQQHENLFKQLGVVYCPSNATDLVRWLTKQAAIDFEEGRSSYRRTRSSAVSWSSPDGSRKSRLERLAQNSSPPNLALAFAGDFSAGFGIVAPMLAIWEIERGIGQWNDRAVAQEHPAVPATVIYAEPSAGVRNSGLYTKVVLGFRPSVSSETCQVPVQISRLPAQPVRGTMMMVVPRSGDCEVPLLVSEMGDPLATFALAGFLVIGALAALKLWSRLSRLEAHRPDLHRPAWTSPRTLVES